MSTNACADEKVRQACGKFEVCRTPDLTWKGAICDKPLRPRSPRPNVHPGMHPDVRTGEVYRYERSGEGVRQSRINKIFLYMAKIERLHRTEQSYTQIEAYVVRYNAEIADCFSALSNTTDSTYC